MLPLIPDGDRLRQVLVVGAHSDDIEIGCGGTLLHLARRHPEAEFVWAVMTGTEERVAEATASAEAFFGDGRSPRVVAPGLADGRLPYDTAAKEVWEGLKATTDPDLVFTHQRDDLHQDHRLLAELAIQTFRDHLILEYEIPKYDGDLGRPNAFVRLDEDIVDAKIDHLMNHFASQRSKRWFTEDLFRSLMRVRGMEAGAPSGHAEAFYAPKLVLK
ncbi:MAG: PIG-L deacetylase family protein [Miltoncostaeaceae bacterium]